MWNNGVIMETLIESGGGRMFLKGMFLKGSDV
jgi:hypothetical protein